MKRIAFLQACLIFLLLVASWFLLINKLRQPDDPSPGSMPPAQGDSMEELPLTRGEAEGDLSPSAPAGLPEVDKEAVVPEGWREWFAYLEDVGSPMEMRAAVEALRSAIFSLHPDEAVARLMEVIESGADMKTGLAFQPGPDRQLRGAASLRAIFLDWLHQLEPRTAAQLAVRELDSLGTGLSPDVYVIHLRNFALGSELPAPARQSALENYFMQLIEYRPWIDNPGSAIAEAMDVAVYLESPTVVPELSRFLQRDQAPLLRRAASLALERLVDRQPMQVLPLLLDPLQDDSVPPRSRASYMARLDPGLPGAADLLREYVRDPAREPSEIRFFLESFPNLNRSLSHNLLSDDFSNTDPENTARQLENAFVLVQDWQNDPQLEAFAPLLAEIQERLGQQLQPNP